MDPLESARCPRCQKVYPLSQIHFCPFARGADDQFQFNPERYSQYGAVSFQIVVLQNAYCMHGEEQWKRDLVLGGTDGRVVIDIIKATALVRWVTKVPHPNAGENNRNGGGWYPQMIDTEHVEPHECLIAVMGESKDAVVAELTQKLDQANAERSDAWSKSVDAGVKAQQAQEALAKATAETERLQQHAAVTDRALTAAANARDEAHRLVKEMRAELERIKTKVGMERFDELRRA